jgi:hypothetical protein
MLEGLLQTPTQSQNQGGQVMKEHSTFIGMDVHKNSIDIAIADQGRKGRVRHYGKIDGTLSALDKVVRKLVSTGSHLHFVYEAGPCGYQIYRHLTSQGLECDVVAPSRIPKPSGSQIKNDRRDALMLARLHRAGELTAVYVPRAEGPFRNDTLRPLSVFPRFRNPQRSAAPPVEDPDDLAGRFQQRCGLDLNHNLPFLNGYLEVRGWHFFSGSMDRDETMNRC